MTNSQQALARHNARHQDDYILMPHQVAREDGFELSRQSCGRTGLWQDGQLVGEFETAEDALRGIVALDAERRKAESAEVQRSRPRGGYYSHHDP